MDCFATLAMTGLGLCGLANDGLGLMRACCDALAMMLGEQDPVVNQLIQCGVGA